MLIVERASGDVVILEPRGRVDATGREEFYRVLSGVVEKGTTKILLDLSQVPYMDSTGLGVLFGTYTSLKKKGGTIRLTGVSDRLRKVLTLVCLDGMIEISESVDDALESSAVHPDVARIAALLTIVASVAAGLPARADAARMTLYATDEFDKMKEQPIGLYPTSNYIWTTTTTDSTITLHGARDEAVACQLLVHAVDNLVDVDVTVSDLVFGGHRVPSDSIRLYLEHEMLIDSVHPAQNGKDGLGIARRRDALIPFRDPYTPGGPRVAGPFDVNSTFNRAVWIDIHVPSNAPRGLYEGTIRVTESTTASPRLLRLRLNVWNFTLPERTGLEAFVGFHPEDFLPCEEVDPTAGGFNADAWDVLEEYELMAHEHRFTIAHKNMVPDATFDPITGALLDVDWSDYDQFLGPVIEGDIFPDGKRPAVWMLPIRPYFRVPFSSAADALALTQWTIEVVNHFQSKGWPLDNAFAWVYDEPRLDGSLAFPSEIVNYATVLHAASPLVNIMMTDAVEDSVLLTAADWWCSKGDKYFPPEMDGLKASGVAEKKYFYQSYSEPGLPVETIDVSGNAWRIWPWIARRHKVDGVMYWAANRWDHVAPYDVPDDQPESYNDGEGTFFYPGAKLDTKGYPEIRGPVSSFRMKAFRRGLQDYEYLERLADKGQATRSDSIAAAMVSSALCATHAATPIYRGLSSRYAGPNQDPRWITVTPGVSEWKQTGNDWYQARVFMGNILSGIGEDTLKVWVLGPNGGESLDAGDAHNITWVTSGGNGTVVIDIFLSEDGGATRSDTLALGTANDGSFSWTVDGPVATDTWCVIRARHSGPTAIDVSDDPFTIEGFSVQLIAPNGGETWNVASPETIRWTAPEDDSVTTVSLRLSTNGGATYPLTIASGEPNDGIAVWTPPMSTPLGSNRRVRVVANDPSGPDSQDDSDASFTLAGAVDDLDLSIRLLQNPVLTRYVDVYVITSKEIFDSSLTVSAGGSFVTMVPSDSSRNTWVGMHALGGPGVLPLTVCARDLGLFRRCETRDIDIALIRRETGTVAFGAGGAISLMVPPNGVSADLNIILGREPAGSTGSPEVWPGASIEAVYEVGPNGRAIAKTATLRLQAAGMDDWLGLLRESGGTWVPVTSFRDGGYLIAGIDLFGRYAVVSSPFSSLPQSQPLPETSVLEGNSPNPFNPDTRIRYILADRVDVVLSVYDATGRRVRTLVDGTEEAGEHQVPWDGTDDEGRNVPSGVYLYRLEAGGVVETRKMVLLK